MARRESVERANEKVGAFATAKKNIIIQYNNQNIEESKLLLKVKKSILENGMKEEEIVGLDVYIKPEEGRAYYVVNEKIQGQITL